MSTKLAPQTKLIVNRTRGYCLCVGELADGPLTRMRGLLGRTGLPAGEGLLLRPAPAIHTAFMRFPIDALFLDRDLRVLKVVERLGPWRVASERKARAVLELSAGECSRRDVRIGDRLELRDRTDIASDWPDLGDVAELNASATFPAGPSLAPAGVAGRAQPLRVLVLSPDRHFRTVMSLLLARRNCSVSTKADASGLADLIAREGTNVVVLDAGELEAAAPIATIQAPPHHVGVVLVADEWHSQDPVEPALAKWGPFTDLAAAIELAAERSNVEGDACEQR